MGFLPAPNKLASAGRSWNDEGMEGGNRLYAGSFWHQVRKKPELWVDKSKKSLANANLRKKTAQ